MKSLQDKKIYGNATLAFLGYGNFPEPHQKEQYDLVTAAGVFMKGHMPKEGLAEIAGFVKKGGFFVTAMREMYYDPEEELGYHGALQELLKNGSYNLHHTYTFKRGLTDEQNVSGNPLFRQLTSLLFVF